MDIKPSTTSSNKPQRMPSKYCRNKKIYDCQRILRNAEDLNLFLDFTETKIFPRIMIKIDPFRNNCNYKKALPDKLFLSALYASPVFHCWGLPLLLQHHRWPGRGRSECPATICRGLGTNCVARCPVSWISFLCRSSRTLLWSDSGLLNFEDWKSSFQISKNK